MERLIAPVTPGRWQLATVTAIRSETPSVKSYTLALEHWTAHMPGQHYDVRLTAPDGYQAQRSYSVASSPLVTGSIELTIDCLLDGEVSPYFHDVVEVGDEIEVRGPFASYFVWRCDEPGPIVLLGGGSGVVPLMSMLRHHRLCGSEEDMRLVYSVRTPDDLIYADELPGDAFVTYTRSAPPGGRSGRIDAALIGEAAAGARLAYVCGSNSFVDAASDLLLETGLDAPSIRTERFN